MLDALRSGFGTDLHRLEAGRPLWLGGLLVPSPVGCVAHSDGDVLLHALIDALLGATALGDIGTFFPPSEAQWKGADSKALLTASLSAIRQHYPAFRVLNVDATLHLEAPKLKDWKRPIAESIAALLALPNDRVSVKAKTGEGLPPIGSGEAVEALVSVLVCV